MTKEQYNRLTEYKNIILTAYHSSFARVSQGEMNRLAEIYKDIYGIGLNKSQMTCNSCRLNALKRLGEDYEKYEVWYNNKYGKRSQKDSNPTGENAPETDKK